ncbi:MAG: toast rack family protein [Longimicrobiales bacterium]
MSDTILQIREPDSRIAIAAALTALALLAPLPALGQDWHTTSYARQATGENHLRVDVEYGAGKLMLAPAATGTLYRASLRYDADAFKPKVTYSGNQLRFGMEGGNAHGRNLKEGQLDLRLSPDVPLDLKLAFGATDATIELGGLRIRSAGIRTGASRTLVSVSSPNQRECRLLEIEVGAAQFEARGLGNLNAERLTLKGGVGEVTLDFTGAWEQDMSAQIDMGLGALTLRVPAGLGVRVEKSGLLAAFDSQRLTRRGNVYYSENWEDATYKLTLDVDAALGSIRVEWVDS